MSDTARRSGSSSVALLLLLLPFGARAASVDFGRDVQPILSDRCFACHGPDEAQRQAGLRLDMRDAAVAPAQSGRVPVQPGNPDGSELLRRVAATDTVTRMPPAYMGHDPLGADEVDTLRRWIEGGAEYEVHWAFRPPARPALPDVSNTGWLREDFDAFALARLDAEQLSPSPEASPATWLRRMMLDLNGLPPTLAETDAFVRAAGRHGESAYEDAVEAALASPRYGERMAMDWLDVARYADTHGFNNDAERSMWRWRDWVIEAFNRNLPYDEFIVEQMAGDLLPDPTVDQLIATGFNRNHVINSEGGIIGEEYRVEYVADRVRTLGMAWLGLTVECARCHDHKFDPVSQEDYYRFFAFFDKVPEIGEAGRVANAVPMMPAPTADQRRRMADLKSRILELERRDDKAVARWEPSEAALGSLAIPEYPANAEFFLGCDDRELAGIAGSACGPEEIKPEEKLKFEENGAFSLSLWFRADSEHEDVALFSAVDYSPDPLSTSYGHGIGLRLVGDEIELRISRRFPTYSITLRSEGAGVRPGEWRHVAFVYEESDGKDSMRNKAAWARLFVDGQEVATRVLHDDAHNAGAFKVPFRLGHDNNPGSGRFEGRLDELAIWKQALTDEQVRQAFEAVALPWASQRAGAGVERRWLYRSLHPDRRLATLRKELHALRRSLPSTMVMQEMSGRRQTHLLIRGRYDSPGKPVSPGVPENLLGRWPDGASQDRLGLARWLVSPTHPTVSRVVANRFWQQVFGVGLVKTSGDFGLQGEAPSHPGLLDWLAVDFMESGWDVKRLMKSIVLSATYRQDSGVTAALLERDPENRLLARGPRFRLPAETIRDQALALAGLLSHRLGGPSVRPYQPEGLYDGIVVGADIPGTKWTQSAGDNLYRRSLYTFWKRTLPHPAMTVFDAPDREFCTVQRSTTNTPLQALTLMNDPTFVEAARKLAERVILDSAPEDSDRVALLFSMATGRSPTREEQGILQGSLARFRESFAGGAEDAADLLGVGASERDSRVEAGELAALAALANLILNLDEVITKG